MYMYVGMCVHNYRTVFCVYVRVHVCLHMYVCVCRVSFRRGVRRVLPPKNIQIVQPERNPRPGVHNYYYVLFVAVTGRK